MGIFTVKATEPTLQQLALLFSTMGWTVGLVMKSSALMTRNGASMALFWSLQPISVRPIMHFLITPAAGATLPSTTLTSPSPSSSALLNTTPASSQSSIAGNLPLVWSIKYYSCITLHGRLVGLYSFLFFTKSEKSFFIIFKIINLIFHLTLLKY